MTKEQFLRKITSRKFLLSASLEICGLIALLTADNQTAQTIIGAITAILPTIVYCISEGIIDAKSVNTVTNVIHNLADDLGAGVPVVQTIDTVGDIVESIVEDSEDEIKHDT